MVQVSALAELFDFQNLLLGEGLMLLVERLAANGAVSLVLILHLDIPALLLVRDRERSFVRFHVVHDIDVGPIDILKDALVGVDTDTHRFVDTCDLDAVARTDVVDEVFVGTEVDGLGSLALGHTLRGLLNLHVLLVREEAAVVLQGELVLGLAMRALDWLNDPAALDKPLFLVEAVVAGKCGLLHLRYDVAVPDDDAAQGHHLVDVFGSELPDAVGLLQVMGPDLDEDVLLLVGVDLVVTAQVVHVEFLVDLRNHEIEDRDQIRGVVLQLAVELGVKGEDMAAVDVEHRQLHVAHFLELLDVVGCPRELLVPAILVDLAFLNEVVDEVFESSLDGVGVDRGSPEHLGVGGHVTLSGDVQLGRGVVRRRPETDRSVVDQVLNFIDAEETSLAGEVRHHLWGSKDRLGQLLEGVGDVISLVLCPRQA